MKTFDELVVGITKLKERGFVTTHRSGNTGIGKTRLGELDTKTLKQNGITLPKVIQNKKKIAQILENYSNKVNYQGGSKKFIREVIQKLSKI